MCKFCPRIRAEAGGQRCDATGMGWAVAGAVLSVVLATKRRIVLGHAPRFIPVLYLIYLALLYVYTHFLCVCVVKTKKIMLCLVSYENRKHLENSTHDVF